MVDVMAHEATAVEVELEYIRQRTAFHEGAHAAVALRLAGVITGPVSIEPRAAWGGITFAEASRPSAQQLARIDVGRPLCEWEPSVRSFFEGKILILLSGAHGGRLVPRPPAGPGGYEPDERTIFRRIVESAPVTVDEQARLARGDDPKVVEDFENDVTAAYTIAEAMVDTAGADPLIRLLDAQARDLVTLEHIRIERLARALLMHTTLSAAAATTILLGDETSTPTSSLRAAASRPSGGAHG